MPHLSVALARITLTIKPIIRSTRSGPDMREYAQCHPLAGKLSPVSIPTPQLANQLLANGETAKAAGIYEQLAKTESNPAQRANYLLQATELYFDAEVYSEATRLYATLPASLNTPESEQRIRVLSAYNTLAQGNHDQALKLLPPTRSITDRITRIRSLELQSRGYELLSQPEQALKARILLDSNLTSPESGSLNRGRIAALLAKARYPNHPAASIDLNGTQVVGDGLQAIGIEQVALLLPLTGRFSAIGDAIKTGFIAARFADG